MASGRHRGMKRKLYYDGEDDGDDEDYEIQDYKRPTMISARTYIEQGLKRSQIMAEKRRDIQQLNTAPYRKKKRAFVGVLSIISTELQQFTKPDMNPGDHKPAPGRRTGKDVKSGKVINKFIDGFENFDDYWTDSDPEESFVSFIAKKSLSRSVQLSAWKKPLRSMSPFTPSNHEQTEKFLETQVGKAVSVTKQTPAEPAQVLSNINDDSSHSETVESSHSETVESSHSETGESSQPETGDSSQPETSESSQTGNGESSQPENYESSQPGDGESSQPGNGESNQSVDGEPSQPKDGESSQPGDGESNQPGDGESSQPGDGESSQPGDGVSKPIKGQSSHSEPNDSPQPVDDKSKKILKIVITPSEIASEIMASKLEHDGNILGSISRDDVATITYPPPKPNSALQNFKTRKRLTFSSGLSDQDISSISPVADQPSNELFKVPTVPKMKSKAKQATQSSQSLGTEDDENEPSAKASAGNVSADNEEKPSSHMSDVDTVNSESNRAARHDVRRKSAEHHLILESKPEANTITSGRERNMQDVDISTVSKHEKSTKRTKSKVKSVEEETAENRKYSERKTNVEQPKKPKEKSTGKKARGRKAQKEHVLLDTELPTSEVSEDSQNKEEAFLSLIPKTTTTENVSEARMNSDKVVPESVIYMNSTPTNNTKAMQGDDEVKNQHELSKEEDICDQPEGVAEPTEAAKDLRGKGKRKRKAKSKKQSKGVLEPKKTTRQEAQIDCVSENDTESLKESEEEIDADVLEPKKAENESVNKKQEVAMVSKDLVLNDEQPLEPRRTRGKKTTYQALEPKRTRGSRKAQSELVNREMCDSKTTEPEPVMDEEPEEADVSDVVELKPVGTRGSRKGKKMEDEQKKQMRKASRAGRQNTIANKENEDDQDIHQHEAPGFGFESDEEPTQELPQRKPEDDEGMMQNTKLSAIEETKEISKLALLNSIKTGNIIDKNDVIIEEQIPDQIGLASFRTDDGSVLEDDEDDFVVDEEISFVTFRKISLDKKSPLMTKVTKNHIKESAVKSKRTTNGAKGSPLKPKPTKKVINKTPLRSRAARESINAKRNSMEADTVHINEYNFNFDVEDDDLILHKNTEQDQKAVSMHIPNNTDEKNTSGSDPDVNSGTIVQVPNKRKGRGHKANSQKCKKTATISTRQKTNAKKCNRNQQKAKFDSDVDEKSSNQQGLPMTGQVMEELPVYDKDVTIANLSNLQNNVPAASLSVSYHQGTETSKKKGKGVRTRRCSLQLPMKHNEQLSGPPQENMATLVSSGKSGVQKGRKKRQGGHIGAKTVKIPQNIVTKSDESSEDDEYGDAIQEVVSSPPQDKLQGNQQIARQICGNAEQSKGAEEIDSDDCEATPPKKTRGRQRNSSRIQHIETVDAVSDPVLDENDEVIPIMAKGRLRKPSGTKASMVSSKKTIASENYEPSPLFESPDVSVIRSAHTNRKRHYIDDSALEYNKPQGAPKSILKNRFMSRVSQASPSCPVHYYEMTSSETPVPPQGSTLVKQVKIIHPETEHIDGLRRSQRTRVRPLDWFRNERILYNRRKSGLVVAGISSPQHQNYLQARPRSRKEKFQQLAKKRKMARAKIPKTPRNLSIHEPLTQDMEISERTEIPVIDPTTSEEVLIECVVTKDQHNFRNALGDKAGPKDPLILSKAIKQPAFSLGQLIIRSLEEKSTQFVRKDSMVFVIKQGKVAVTIHRTTEILEADDSFFVPQGNTYSIKNLRKDEAKLWFFQHKG